MIFLYLQNNMYNSSNLETSLPWGSLDLELANMRAIWKFLLSISFIFNKSGDVMPYTRLGAFFIGMIIAIKRLANPVVLDRSVFFASSFYDLFVSQIFFHVAIT